MKTGLFPFHIEPARTRTAKVALLTLIAATAAVPSGCTHVAKTRAKTEAKLQEHSRAFTTAVLDTLHAQPTHQRDQFTELALQLAQHDQQVEGLPLEPLRVGELLGLEWTNLPPQEAAANQKVAHQQLDRRVAEIQRLRAQEHRTQEHLLAFGERFEVERNKQRMRWLQRGTLLTVVFGGFIALVVLVPASVPVLGRILAWCVARFPALAGTAGVVSVKAFDAVVKAIERMKSTQPLENQPHKFGNFTTPAHGLDELHLHLSREMDAAHKALVRKRKTALELDR